ncbi:ABC transporter ATP-binding protein [Lysinibacillus pakistanensis]|uniref:ABC transporter ATP-binding protein n=1 Tax=Lysinibacillus pakistanensis TaxID=759811 RepID=A0AAX3WU47_9BACI|nr:ABC transporter ATP-binding protein [Lysinibacillus pakistanensis]MDM5230799.1 ABC transporter ATP-binding protein [Lysinibacillus pakistanensis]QGG53516.1 ATP-binding cassette domain-containing protein [Lysinibacillus pakistanensis]WHY46368.1 ABC transporter ATP-binding protein [Lysinibacillus pakistanensis]WHY51380.1 ABC transporter ATP-binding protein [Lysinibacillus pakistanensis]
MEYIVQTENLSKSFGKEQAVSNINLKIRKGEIYGFLGPNGAGKTTTIRMLLGLMKPSSGTIKIFQKDVTKDRINILAKVGSLVENPSYYPHLTAYENLEALRKILGVPKSRIDEVLAIVRLKDAANKKVKGFSLGMKQRLGIAASLLHNPELLILDEPTNGLDPSGIIEIRNLIKRLPAEYGMTIIISSHLLSEIDQMATQVGIVSKGKMIFQDSIEAMRKSAQPKVFIKVSDAEKGWRSLVAHGIKAEHKEGLISLDECSDEKVAHIVQILVQEGILVYRVEEEKRSLEDIFLQMTTGEQLI